MADVKLKIEHLLLDQTNPRSEPSTNQREALRKLLADTGGAKLAELAESIVEEERLNPMDRLLVIRETVKPKRFTVLEGNRRAAALKILSNPAVLGSMQISAPLRKRFELAAQAFDRTTIEPIVASEVLDRDEAKHWLTLRHTGENEGRGVVGWSNAQQARFLGSNPELQAVDFVINHGSLSEEEKHHLQGRFLSTVKRLLEAPAVRSLIGVEVHDGKLVTGLPADEVIKPLRRIVTDLASKKVKVSTLKTVADMVRYVKSLDQASMPDLTKKGSLQDVTSLGTSTPVADRNPASTDKAETKRHRHSAAKRVVVVPKGCVLNVTDSRISGIYDELRALKLEEAKNAIAVLLRVFLELSVDHYLRRNSIALSYPPKGSGKGRFKSLQDKVTETVDHLVAAGAEPKVFTAAISGLSDPKSPLWFDLLHAYIHSNHATPTTDNLKAAWDHATPLFERIWP